MYDSFGSDDKTITTLGFWNSVNDAQLVFDRISTFLKNRYNGPQNFVYEVPNDVKEDKNER